MSISVILFKSKTCPNCQRVLPIFNEAVASFKDILEFSIVDIIDNRQLAIENAVMSVPTIIFFKDNREVTRLSGLVSKEKIEQTIKEL